MFTHLQEFINSKINRFQFNRSVSFKAAIGVFLLSSLSIMAIVRRLEQDRLRVKRDRVSHIANDYATDIQRNMERSLSVTYAVSALVNEYQGIIPNFQTVAGDLLPLYPGVYALALLPNGRVKKFIALKEPQTAIAHNHLKSLNQNQSALIAKKTEKLSLTTNFPLDRDSSDAVGYLPIFLENERGNKYFWGFTTVTIRLPEVLQDLHLEKLEQRGFAYQLRRVDPETNQQQIFAKSWASITDRPVEKTIEIANTSWTLSLTPIAGWHQPVNFWLKSLLGFAFSLMLATVVKLFIDSKVYAFELEKIAYFDPLTSLPNRRFLLYRLEQIIAHTKRNGKQIAICYLDLDNFRAINERLGHKAGDYILVRIAKRLQKFLRLDDVIARIGGDEFVIVLQDLSHSEEAELVLERIIEAVTNPITLESETISISASIGIAMYSEEDYSIDTLIDYAERAISHTKQNNKGGYTLFSQLEKNIAPASPFL